MADLKRRERVKMRRRDSMGSVVEERRDIRRSRASSVAAENLRRTRRERKARVLSRVSWTAGVWKKRARAAGSEMVSMGWVGLAAAVR